MQLYRLLNDLPFSSFASSSGFEATAELSQSHPSSAQVIEAARVLKSCWETGP